MFGPLAWLLVVPILGFLIFIHELGHFVTAKWFGIKVTEFGFGFPPRIWGFRRGETIYSINWIPLGGFVRMVGEDGRPEKREDVERETAAVFEDAKKQLATLRLSRPASESEVRRAYRLLVLETHPLRNPGDPDAETRFREISEAYRNLKGSAPGLARLGFHDWFTGADPGSEPSVPSAESLRASDDPRSFANQTVLKRAIVLSAGSFMNLVVPIIIFVILFMLPQDTVVGSVIISGVAPDSPAQDAGLRAGDSIVRVDGETVDNHVVLIQSVMAKLGSPIELTVQRGSIISGFATSPEFASLETVTLTPRLNPPALVVVEEVQNPEREISLAEARRYNVQLGVGDEMTQGAIGVMVGTNNQRTVKRSHSFTESVPMAFERMLDVLRISKNGINRWAVGGPDPGLAGPIGIARVTGEVAKVGISPLFEFMALISISLGIVNILPIPALDGGRLMFVMIEWVRRGKRISPQREGLVHLVGFAVLISLIVIISISDIRNILNGVSAIR